MSSNSSNEDKPSDSRAPAETPGRNLSEILASEAAALAAQQSNQPAPEPAADAPVAPRRVLAIDTALGACAAAIYDAASRQTLAVQSIDMSRGHAEALMPLVERVMRVAGVGFGDIERIATTTGPGSFTGLRVGIAAARGFGLVCKKPVVGVSTLAAFAGPHAKESDPVPVVSVIDAKHGNLYFQMLGAGGRMLVAPRIGTLDEALRAVATGFVRMAGPGAALLASYWPVAKVPMPEVADTRAAPDITWVARLGAEIAPHTAPPRPLYLRPPDAKPQDAQRLPRR